MLYECFQGGYNILILKKTEVMLTETFGIFNSSPAVTSCYNFHKNCLFGFVKLACISFDV